MSLQISLLIQGVLNLIGTSLDGMDLVPLSLVSMQAQLICRSTCSAKLLFFQKVKAVVVIIDFSHIQDYEE